MLHLIQPQLRAVLFVSSVSLLAACGGGEDSVVATGTPDIPPAADIDCGQPGPVDVVYEVNGGGAGAPGGGAAGQHINQITLTCDEAGEITPRVDGAVLATGISTDGMNVLCKRAAVGDAWNCWNPIDQDALVAGFADFVDEQPSIFAGDPPEGRPSQFGICPAEFTVLDIAQKLATSLDGHCTITDQDMVEVDPPGGEGGLM